MLPLVSSEKVMAALHKLACYCPHVADGSHLAVCRHIGDRKLVQPVPQGKKEILRTTLGTILNGLEITEEEFKIALGGQYKRSALRARKRSPSSD